MSHALVRHFWNNNREAILASSFMNCHAKGLHSVMLHNVPGQRIRLFVTDVEHDLWKNYPYGNQRMSIGYHGHHCDITLEVVKGTVGNVELGRMPGRLALHEFVYHSKILTGEAHFEKTGKIHSFMADTRILKVGETVWMPATDYHSIMVQSGQTAAWLVFEGKDDPNYVSNMFTNWDMSGYSFDELYQPMNEEQARWCLGIAGIL